MGHKKRFVTKSRQEGLKITIEALIGSQQQMQEKYWL